MDGRGYSVDEEGCVWHRSANVMGKREGGRVIHYQSDLFPARSSSSWSRMPRLHQGTSHQHRSIPTHRMLLPCALSVRVHPPTSRGEGRGVPVC